MELRQQQRVNPRAVGSAADELGDFGAQVGCEQRLHIAHAGEVTVVRERDRRGRNVGELHRAEPLQRGGESGDLARYRHRHRADTGEFVNWVPVAEVNAGAGGVSPLGLPQPGGKVQATGSGFVIDGDGHIVTNAHVVDNDRQVEVKLGDKNYDLALRFKRAYKPYSMHLEDVRFDKYMGTQMARNYSSDLRLVDKSRNVDRDVHIWMNNPLRFAGETFYQSSFNVDELGVESTVLQVVANSGWMIPYVACMLVGTGMLAQFSITLVRFLRRRDEDSRVETTQPRRNRAAVVAGEAVALAAGGVTAACGGTMFVGAAVAATGPGVALAAGQELRFDGINLAFLKGGYAGKISPVLISARKIIQ